MSNRYDDADREGRSVGRVLHDRVDPLNESPLTLEDVSSRARTMRRHRRIAVGVGIVAAAAVVVPLAALAGGGLSRSSDPGFATGSPSPNGSVSASPTPTPGGGPAPLDVSALPTGTAPAIDWAGGTTIHHPDGTSAEVPGLGRILQVVPMGAGWIAAVGGEQGELEAVRVSSNGTAGDPTPLDGGLAVSPEGQVVAWAAPDGSVTVVQAQGTETFEMKPINAPGPYSAVAVTSEDCKEGRTTDAGCSVIVNTLGEHPRAYQTTSHGLVDELPGGVLKATAYHGLTAGITEVHDDLTTCSALLDGAAVRWRTCDFRVLGFSPDTEHLVAVGSVGDGLGDGELAILDATGDPLVHLVSTRQHPTSVVQVAWEDDDHVLAVTWAGGQWAVVRIGLDGSMEYAVAPVAGTDTDRPFALQAR